MPRSIEPVREESLFKSLFEKRAIFPQKHHNIWTSWPRIFSGTLIFQQLAQKTPVFGTPLLWRLFFSRIKRGSGGLGERLLITGPRPSGENPEVMGQDGPRDLKLAIFKTFCQRGSTQEDIFEDPDTTFRL